MIKLKTICIYCGSKAGKNPEFEKSAKELGKFLAQNNIGIIYGGGITGLMGAMASSAIKHGGKVTGIIPQHLYDLELKNKSDTDFKITDLIITKNMHERKQIMYEKADAFITLAGSIGTLDETMEMITWRQLKRHNKPIFILNQDHYWQPLFKLIDHLILEEFTTEATKGLYIRCDSLKELLQKLL